MDITKLAIFDNNSYLAFNYLDITILKSFSLLNRINRLFSLTFIKEKTIFNKKRWEKCIRKCFFHQPFIILYQSLYISKDNNTKKRKRL